MRQFKLQLTAMAGLSFLAISAVQAGPATVLAANGECELAIVQKPDEFGLVTVFTPNAVSVGDVLDGDFESIKYIRKARNQTTGKDVMIRGIRYSTSRRILEGEVPPECKFAAAAATEPAK
jgi:hypothetical protein